jgi:hypothetical protein
MILVLWLLRPPGSSSAMYTSVSAATSHSTMPISSLVKFLIPISKEAHRIVMERVWCDVSSRTCLAELNPLLHEEKFILFYSCVLRVE